MNMLVLIAISCLLLILIINFDAVTNRNYANGVINNDLNYKIQNGTVCSDKDNQLPLIILENGTQIIGEPPARCWIVPDYGEGIGNLVGTSNPDIIYGRDGMDVLQGKESDDILDGGKDDDVLFGDDGNDHLLGSYDDDQMFGGNNNDVMEGSIGDDYILGGNGNDELYGSQGNDILKGGYGADIFDCGEDIDMVLDYNSFEGDLMNNSCEKIKKPLIN